MKRVYHDPDTSEALHEKIDPFVVSKTCSTCQGYRVGEAARNTFIGEKNIGQVSELSVEHAEDFFASLHFDSESTKVAHNVLKNIKDRLHFLKGVGLGYMTLARRSNTLS